MNEQQTLEQLGKAIEEVNQLLKHSTAAEDSRIDKAWKLLIEVNHERFNKWAFGGFKDEAA